MMITRSSLVLGSVVAAALAQVTTIAENIAEAFEPDLEAWETLPVAQASAVGVRAS